MAKTSTAKTLSITQVRSTIGCPPNQRATIKALGLKRMNDSVQQADNPVVRGMIARVRHLVVVKEA
jgi:large subunit ribosomal protein L30